MKKMLCRGVLVSAAIAGSASVLAEPYLPSDPRALGMGGASTATAEGPNSVLYNSALASPNMRNYRSGFAFPTLGVSVADRDNFIDAYDDYDDSNVVDRIGDDIGTFNNTFEMIRARIDDDAYDSNEALESDIALLSNDLGQVSMTQEELEERIAAMSDKPLTFDLRGSGSFGTRIGQWGTGLHYQSRAYAGGAFQLDPNDFGLVGSAFDQASGIVGCLEEAAEGSDPDQDRLEECRDRELPDDQTVDEFLSEFQFQGAILSEFGLTFARDFQIAGREVAFGVTPKVIDVSTFDYVVGVQDERDVDIDDRERSHGSLFNVDLGFAMPIRDDMRIGATVKNLIPETFETIEGNEIDLEPQVRVGFSWDRRMFTLATDLDLTENKPMGFGPDTRFLSLGGELRPLQWLQLRAGYRMNLADSDIIDDVASFGVGFAPGPVRVDLGVASSSREVAAYMQFGLSFGG
ncbi:hypothetical protein J2T60_000223 [Natronospira proteinivora]|uniref:F plasmid transfer operon protein TraF n=1 Tax=Natronospira proteinivora TaxID=1807133 RepID=A0ABT1G7C0_9GAMM|nr:conjugal transfer protein TraF [Natronospira proteinivora]MCP1726258.1 hypothetical protein [Natronospira proteinivora]